jgi:lipopolysaccharide export system permease protein
MRLLDRYLFRELVVPLVFCLVGIQSFIMVATVLTDSQKIQDSKLHFVDTIEYACASSVESLPIILPMSLLLALLMAMSTHARHNEITAMRAAGISLWRICLPYFVAGAAACGVMFALNEYFIPRGADWVDQILNRYVQKPDAVAIQKRPLGFENERAHRKWLFMEFHAGAGELDHVEVTWTSPDGVDRLLNADRAVLTNGVWTFFNANEKIKPVGEHLYAPLLQTNALAIPEFTESPREFKVELKIHNYEKMGSRKKMVPLKDILDYLWLRPGINSAWLQTQLHQHLATPFTCLVVVLIAIPFSAASGRRNLFFGVAGSIFICFLYFVIQQMSLAAGAGGHLPGWMAAWLPNAVFAVTGIILTTRVR